MTETKIYNLEEIFNELEESMAVVPYTKRQHFAKEFVTEQIKAHLRKYPESEVIPVTYRTITKFTSGERAGLDIEVGFKTVDLDVKSAIQLMNIVM